MNIILLRKRTAETDVINGVCVRAKVLLHVWSYDCFGMTLSTENSDVM